MGLDRHVGDCFAHTPALAGGAREKRGLAMTRGWQVALSIDFATALTLRAGLLQSRPATGSGSEGAALPNSQSPLTPIPPYKGGTKEG